VQNDREVYKTRFGDRRETAARAGCARELSDARLNEQAASHAAGADTGPLDNRMTIPPEIQSFILHSIDSIAHLEALLLLREQRQAAWNCPAVAQRLYVPPPQCEAILERLHELGFLTLSDDGYRFAGGPEIDAMIGTVAELYATQLIPVTNLIHSKPRRVQQFADAFKLRKDS
jgi:hypothetical protein